MDISSDDDMYRVDSVWLGPPKATFPWRARYVSWGIGLVTTLLVLSVLRTWYSFGFFVVAWSVVIAVGITRAVGKKITHERPMRDVARMAIRETNTPRYRSDAIGGAADASAIRVRRERPRPTAKRARRSCARRTALRDAPAGGPSGGPQMTGGQETARAR